ncbi:MAG: TatD family hydrolase [Patescibacteria group bacterium]
MLLFDSHAHLHFPAYADDVDAVLGRMQDKDMGAITVGTTMANSEKAIAFAEAHEQIWASVALHPEHLTSDFHDKDEGEAPEREVDEARLEQVASSSKKVVAIGETGLDFHWIDEGLDRDEAMEKQEQGFLAHIRVASKLGLPLIIHSRDAFERTVAVLKQASEQGMHVRGVMHSFSGSWEEAQVLLGLGFSLGVNGVVTFKPRKIDPPERWLSRTVEQMPLDRLLIETDAPYLAPTPHRGKRNEPVYVEEVAKKIAEIRGISLEEVTRISTENARKLFGV